MNEATARQILEVAMEVTSKLDSSVELVMRSCDDEEFKVYRASVARVLGALLTEIINPIVVEHPPLRPDGF